MQLQMSYFLSVLQALVAPVRTAYPSLGIWNDSHNGVEQRGYVVRIHHELGRGKNNGERKKRPGRRKP